MAVSVADVRSAFTAFIETLGTDRARKFVLVEGSKTYGNSFGVYEVDPHTGGRTTILWLGYTRREAFVALNAARNAVYFTNLSY